MRWIWAMLILILWCGVGAAQADCVAESRLTVGDYARVTPGDANNVRAEPNAGADLVGQVPGGALFQVVGDAVCDRRFVWIQVEYAGITGWTVEANASDYWVEHFEAETYSDGVISFAYPPGYLEDVTADVQPAQEAMGGSIPAQADYELQYPGDATYYGHDIIVMHAGDITDDAPLAAESLDNLRTLLTGRPSLTGPILEPLGLDSTPGSDFFPLDPMFRGAQRIFVAAAHYVTMQGGEGVAFVTFYAQDAVPITDEGIFYNYLALTDDGEYYVTVRLPISTEALPATYDDFVFPNVNGSGVPVGWAENYGDYRAQVASQLEALTPGDWSPTMDTLDTILSSLRVLADFENVEGHN